MIMSYSEMQNKVLSMIQTYEELETIVSQLERTLTTLNQGSHEAAKSALSVVVENVKLLLDGNSEPLRSLPAIVEKSSH